MQRSFDQVSAGLGFHERKRHGASERTTWLAQPSVRFLAIAEDPIGHCSKAGEPHGPVGFLRREPSAGAAAPGQCPSGYDEVEQLG